MKTVLSSRKMKIRAATIEKSLEVASKEAELGHGYIYRIGGKDTMSLNTLSRIAKALDCRVCDLLEEVEEDDAGDTPTPTPTPITLDAIERLRQAKRDALIPKGSTS